VGSGSRAAKLIGALAAIAVVALIVIPAALAAFGAQTQNESNIVTAAPDFTPPAITATVVAKTLGGVTGFVRKTGTYFAYANVSPDTGNPASGTATVSANLAQLTSTQTAAVLTAGTYTAGGVSYDYRSAELTADAATEGAKTFTVTATDHAGNAGTVAGAATVDNTPPTATDIQTANGGTTVGLAEEKDSITYTFSEPIEPESILAGWTGAATNVTVRIIDSSLILPTGDDAVQIYDSANSKVLPLGTVDLGRNDYAAGLVGGNFRFLNSKMTMSGNTITIVFGTYNTGVLEPGRTTAAGTGTMTWTPVAGPYDRAGNPISTAPATESGPADKEF
jgi:hypothetical protein